MIRWILTLLLCVLLVFCSNESVLAQGQTSDLNESQIQQLNELRQEAFAATEKGDFPIAEGYWTQLIELLPDNPVGWSNR